jgi:hypothetical protein
VEGNVLAESRVMAVTNLFRLIDFDGSGTLIVSEVRSVLYAAGISDAVTATLLHAFGFIPEVNTMAEIHGRLDAGSDAEQGVAKRECNLDRFLDVVIRADDDEIPGAQDFTLSKLIKVGLCSCCIQFSSLVPELASAWFQPSRL